VSRRDRRAEVRLARRSLRRRGCDCRPEITLLPRRAVAALGMTHGAAVRHDAGCPFGDRFVPLNRLGIVPEVVDRWQGCRR
jgi:hypothetical protein